jgi:hypothetical protein
MSAAEAEELHAMETTAANQATTATITWRKRR